MLYPEREADNELKQHLSYLSKLNISVYYPFLLKLYDLETNTNLTRNEFASMLDIIESYIVRGLCHQNSSKSMDKLFAQLCKLLQNNIKNALLMELSSRGSWSPRYWPTDKDFKEDLLKLPLYERSALRSLILERLEKSFNHPEVLDINNLTVEHIMPEVLNVDWKNTLGENSEEIYKKYLHTLSNLTLIAQEPNSSIGQEAFAIKKERWYSKSNVELTKDLCKFNKWTEVELKQRSNELFDRAVRIWARPNFEYEHSIDMKELRSKADGEMVVCLSKPSGITFLIQYNAWGFIRLSRQPKYIAIYITNPSSSIEYFAEVEKVISPSDPSSPVSNPNEFESYGEGYKLVIFKPNSLYRLTSALPTGQKHIPRGLWYTELSKFVGASSIDNIL